MNKGRPDLVPATKSRDKSTSSLESLMFSLLSCEFSARSAAFSLTISCSASCRLCSWRKAEATELLANSSSRLPWRPWPDPAPTPPPACKNGASCRA
jgi:hypothetical protein